MKILVGKKMDWVGKKIKKLMEIEGLTFEALAEKAEVAKRTVELAITDPRNRTLETLDKIAKALGTTVYELLLPYVESPFEPEPLPEVKKRKLYVRLPEPLLDEITQIAKNWGISRAAVIAMYLGHALRMIRVECVDCERTFWVEPDAEVRCPYCGNREGEGLEGFDYL